jgi:hypothetical protein
MLGVVRRVALAGRLGSRRAGFERYKGWVGGFDKRCRARGSGHWNSRLGRELDGA